MSSLSDLFGPTLLKHGEASANETVSTSILSGKSVLVYFSAHWCPPCRGFTPMLKEFYQRLKTKRDDFEVVFVSSDRDLKSFEEYYGEMPWLALPYDNRRLASQLSETFKVQGIPSLVSLSSEGAVLTLKARNSVIEDPEGINFPWKAATFSEIMVDGPLLTHSENQPSSIQELLKKEIIAFYFSAHWCPPCRGFTPKLIESYNRFAASGEKIGEVVFCSSDNSEEEFNEYFGGMPWVSLPFGDARIEQLSSFFDVEGIPTLITVKPDGTVINLEATDSVRNGGEFPWDPVPIPKVLSIEDDRMREVLSTGINVFLDLTFTSDDSVKPSFISAVEAAANEFPIPVYGFYSGLKESGEPLSEAAVNACPQDHPLEILKTEELQNRYCDICRDTFSPEGGGGRTCRRCNFDRCAKCYDTRRPLISKYNSLLEKIRKGCSVQVPENNSSPLVYAVFLRADASATLTEPISSSSITALINTLMTSIMSQSHGCGGCEDEHCGDHGCGDGCEDEHCGDHGCDENEEGCEEDCCEKDGPCCSQGQCNNGDEAPGCNDCPSDCCKEGQGCGQGEKSGCCKDGQGCGQGEKSGCCKDGQDCCKAEKNSEAPPNVVCEGGVCKRI